MKKISIILPIFNEEQSIATTIATIKEVMKKVHVQYELIAVNDGSKDNSALVLKQIKGIKVINHPYNKGYGAALKTGIKEATSDWILITDVDGTYPLKDIPRLIRCVKDFDMVVGARRGKQVTVPLLRRPAKFILGRVASYVAGRNIPDLNSGFRIFRKEMALRYWNLFPSGFSFTSTITMVAFSNDYSVQYISINYFKRKGKSTIHPIKDFVGFLNLLTKLVMYFNPFKIFFPFFVFFLIVSFLRAIRDFLLLDYIGNLTIILFITSFQILFLGLIADLINKRTMK